MKNARVALLLSLAAGLVLAALYFASLVSRRRAAERLEQARDIGRFASPEFPLNRGLVLLVFLSTDCSHCLETARQIATFDAAAHDLRITFILLGRPAEVEPFFQSVGTWTPYQLATPQDYADFAGEDPPTLYLLSHGSVLAQWSGSHFNLDVLSAELSRRR